MAPIQPYRGTDAMRADIRGSTTSLNGSLIAQRAGEHLSYLYPGPSKHKRIARDLGISERMAQLLRSGKGWTLARFGQVSQRFGWGFVAHVLQPIARPDPLDRDLDALRRLLALLEAQTDGMRGDVGTLVAGEVRTRDASVASGGGAGAPRGRGMVAEAQRKVVTA